VVGVPETAADIPAGGDSPTRFFSSPIGNKACRRGVLQERGSAQARDAKKWIPAFRKNPALILESVTL
jgi:hypothetical protein